MKLKEFDLDLPNAGRDARRDFRWQTRSVCALYTRCFGALNTKRGWKVLVECVENPKRSEPLEQLGVLCQEVPFDLVKYFGLDTYRRKAMALEALHEGALGVALAEGWPMEPFEAARRSVIEMDYVNKWTWPKRVRSPAKQWFAYLSCRHEPDAFTAWLVVTAKSGEDVARVLAIHDVPSEFIFTPRLGSLRWTGSDRVALFDKAGEKVVELLVNPAG